MNQEKIREVALSVADEFGYSTNSAMRNNFLPDFLTRCLQELSKDVEPVGYFMRGFEPGNDWEHYVQVGIEYSNTEWSTPLYLHPPLTEQDIEAAIMAKFECVGIMDFAGRLWSGADKDMPSDRPVYALKEK